MRSAENRAESKAETARKKMAVKSCESSLFEIAAAEAGLNALPGKSAVKSQYQASVVAGGGLRFTASVDIDSDLKAADPQASRWDYGLGLRRKTGEEFAVWIEHHPASSTSEVARIIAKLDWLENKLKCSGFEGLRALTQRAVKESIPRFHWLAMTGAIRIRPGSREAALLSKRGLRLPSRQLVLS
jgi:hypothetical protein